MFLNIYSHSADNLTDFDSTLISLFPNRYSLFLKLRLFFVNGTGCRIDAREILTALLCVFIIFIVKIIFKTIKMNLIIFIVNFMFAGLNYWVLWAVSLIPHIFLMVGNFWKFMLFVSCDYLFLLILIDQLPHLIGIFCHMLC